MSPSLLVIIKFAMVAWLVYVAVSVKDDDFITASSAVFSVLLFVHTVHTYKLHRFIKDGIKLKEKTTTASLYSELGYIYS